MSAHKDQNPSPGATGANDAADAPTPEAADAAERSVPATDDAPEKETVQTAGAFDIRNFIGTLLGLFGLVLVAMGLFAFDTEAAAKTGGLNANLWAGLAMLIVGIGFVVWTKVDPIRMVVRENEDGAEESRDIAALD